LSANPIDLTANSIQSHHQSLISVVASNHSLLGDNWKRNWTFFI